MTPSGHSRAIADRPHSGACIHGRTLIDGEGEGDLHGACGECWMILRRAWQIKQQKAGWWEQSRYYATATGILESPDG